MAPHHCFKSVLALAAAVLATSAGADTPDRTGGSAGDPEWRTYVDPDRGTAVEYPAGVFSVEAGAPERGSGREFRTKDGRARLIGAKIEWMRRPGGGTIVECWLG